MWLIALALVCLIYIIVVYVRRVCRVSRAVRQANRTQDNIDPMVLSPVSIVVYAQSQSSWLEELLPGLLSQDYPAGFEIIVVNDGESEATANMVERLAINHPNLYLTFTPDGARSLSRRKLGITIGIKAAKNDVVIVTDAVAKVESPFWLRSIMANYVKYRACDVVLGYAYMSDGDSRMGKRRRAFDYVADSVTWLTAALAGKPYMGTRYNLAYTRELFFNNKGFSRSLNLVNGDDDIFISEIANGYNTVVELSDDSMVMANYREHAAALSDERRRHAFTGRRVSCASRLMMVLGEIALWLTIIAGGFATCLSWGNLVVPIVSLVIVLTGWLTMTVAWSAAMQALRGRRLRFSLPWLILMRPLRLLKLHAVMRLGKITYYTWKK